MRNKRGRRLLRYRRIERNRRRKRALIIIRNPRTCFGFLSVADAYAAIRFLPTNLTGALVKKSCVTTARCIEVFGSRGIFQPHREVPKKLQAHREVPGSQGDPNPQRNTRRIRARPRTGREGVAECGSGAGTHRPKNPAPAEQGHADTGRAAEVHI